MENGDLILFETTGAAVYEWEPVAGERRIAAGRPYAGTCDFEEAMVAPRRLMESGQAQIDFLLDVEAALDVRARS